MNEEQKRAEEQKRTEEREAARELISNAEEIGAETAAVETTARDEDDENKVFRKYKIKDIVFLAIMAAAMLVTGCVMPFAGRIPVFGMTQLCLSLQFSVLPAIGLMKVRKAGSLLLMSLFAGVVLVFMDVIMFACLAFCALVAEAVVLLVFRGYRKDAACFFAAWIYFPLSMPFVYVWNLAISAEITGALNPWYVKAAMCAAVVALCCIGALVGVKIGREMRKSGALKK